MHFDDRLATALRMRAAGPALARVQYRQLLDLLGNGPPSTDAELREAGYARLAELSQVMPIDHRMTVLRDKATRLRMPRLVAAVAQSAPGLAEPAIDAAELNAAQWIDLLPALPPAAKQRLRARSDLPPELIERLARLGVNRPGLPPAALDAAAVPAEAAAEQSSTGSIGAIVKRIEAYRKSRQTADVSAISDAPRLPLGEDHVLHVPREVRAFDFATDPAGRIVWADPGVAPMVIGLDLAAPTRPAALGEAVRHRQPISGAHLMLTGAAAVAGEWRVDATARFTPLTGQYLGHQGRMRRWPAARRGAARDSQADRIRQLLHELRTPVNAIQGFAEVIQQQLFGATPHEYRALAATIAGDAARMLAAFEELERLAKLESAALELEPGNTDAAEVFTATVAQLAAHTGQRGSGFNWSAAPTASPVPLAQLEIERIAWRLLATLAGSAAPGEQLPISLTQCGAGYKLTVALPASLARRSDKDLFEAAAGAVPQVIAAGVFGVGFALRLVRAEAKASGGDLIRQDELLILTLAGLTPQAEDHSQSA